MGQQVVFSGAHLVAALLSLCAMAALVYLLVLAAKALRKYLRSSPARQENALVRQTLGERIRDRRMKCRMTQEFVAESLGVSRQAVSKWESGASDPSTSNLIALAKLLNVPVESFISGAEK